MKGMILQTGITAEEIISQQDSVLADISRFAEGMINNPKDTLTLLGEKAIDFGMSLLAALAIYFVGAWLIMLIKKKMAAILDRRKTDRAVASFVKSLTSILLTLILIMVVVSTLGINTTSIAALLAAGGMAIGMALSGTVQNFAGGIMILVFHPFKVGDFISAQGFVGTVSEISIVNTILHTSDGRMIFIPNGTLFNGNIDNYTRCGNRRVEWKISLEYGCDAQKAIDFMTVMVKQDPRVLPADSNGVTDVFAGVTELADSGVIFTIRAWVKAHDFWEVFYDMNKRFYTELPKEGFNFPFPQMDVRVEQKLS